MDYPNKVAKMLKLKKERVAIETLRFARLAIWVLAAEP